MPRVSEPHKPRITGMPPNLVVECTCGWKSVPLTTQIVAKAVEARHLINFGERGMDALGS